MQTTNTQITAILTHLSTEFSAKPTLDYPFGDRWSPEFGEPFEVSNDVFWLRMPLPIALDHINLWLLRDGDGWTIVDSGYDAPVCEGVWERVFSEFLKPNTVKRVIITHLHPDHIGLAGWLARRCDCPIWMSRGEFEQYDRMLTRDLTSFEEKLEDYTHQLGLSHQDQQNVVRFFTPDDKPAERRVQKELCYFIADKDEFNINNKAWRVVSGNGHSPEHACLYCPELSVFISGDQSIPRISSNVSVYPDGRAFDPLGDWIDSCEKLRDNIPNNTLILPSHQEPFKGIVQRMQHMINDHHVELNRLRIALEQPMTLVKVRETLFKRDLSPIEMLLASGEALAHLHYLMQRDEVTASKDQHNIAHYKLA